MPFSNYQRRRVLGSVFRGASYVNETTLYIALLKSAPTPDDVGANLDEADYDGYARADVSCDDSSWDINADGDLIENLAPIQFPQVVSGLNIITHFAILDSATVGGGNVIAYGNLQVPATVESSDDPYFDAGTLFLNMRE